MHIIRGLEEAGVIAIARSSKDVVSNDVANGAPCKDVDDVEPDGVVGLEESDVLLGPDVAGVEVGLPVLARHLLGQVLPLESEEDEPAQEEGEAGAQADHQRRVELRPDGAAAANRQGSLAGEGEAGGEAEGAEALEGAVEGGRGGEEGSGHGGAS